MKYIVLILVVFFLNKWFSYVREISNLERQVKELKEERPDIWIESCRYAVEGTCFYGECASDPIEIIQEKLCKVPEDL